MRQTPFIALAALVAAPAYAQAPAAEGAVVYTPDFFARFSPRTAYDMVSRVPGFTLDEGEERRGLSGAAGNVRIDGDQPTAKSQSLEDILAGIPAADVARVELVRGESSGATGGQTSFVNVVRVAGAGGKTIWTLGGLISKSRFAPQGEAALTHAIGEGVLTLNGAYLEERGVATGPRARFDAAGALVQTREQRMPYTEKTTRFSAGWDAPLLGGDLALTGQVSRAIDKEHIVGPARDAAGAPLGSADSSVSETEDSAEAGFTFGRTLGAWTLDLSGLLTRTKTQEHESEIARSSAGQFEESESGASDARAGETILRTVLSRAAGVAKLELGVEAALNTLEQELALEIDIGAGPQAINLPSANVSVEEKRAEAYATITLPLAGWTAEATIAAETSRLSQEGDVNQTTALTYWKPSIQFVRPIGASNQIRVRFYRDIGQLNFEDFVAAATLADNAVFAGNPDLRPETSWRVEAAADWRFGGDGALAATVYRWWVEDALDVIPFGPPGARFAAPGNIGKADVYGAKLSFTLPLARLIAGAQLTGEGVFQHSEATDPLTGEARSLSSFEDVFARLSFRQDLPARAFAWGAEYSEALEVAANVRPDEIETHEGAPNWQVFVETTAIAPLKIRGWYQRLPGPPQYRSRLFFRPDRLAAFAGRETIERDPGSAFGVTVSGVF